MKNHNLTDRSTYPQHHIWEASDKVNVYSSKEIKTNDTIIYGSFEAKVKSVKHQAPNSDQFKGTVFYELDVERK